MNLIKALKKIKNTSKKRFNLYQTYLPKGQKYRIITNLTKKQEKQKP